MQRSALSVLTTVIVALTAAFGVTTQMALAEEPSETAVADGVVAFYFHGNVRCATCKKIEAYADEAVHQGFADAIQNGALTWRVANVEEPENRHFIQDFQLVTRSVVLAEYRDGNVVRWKNLDKVWQLVRSKNSFVEYVQDEAREFLGAS
jgi:hypothetical protein